LIRALRPHQWVKNLLLLAPLLMSHEPIGPLRLRLVSTAMVCFSLIASCVYILNDLIDRDSDRRHPTKRFRPFASGELSPRTGIALILGLSTASYAIAFSSLPSLFGAMLAGYSIVSTLYSVWLKRKILIDVLCLAGLYTLRILAGGAAAQLVVSPWLMAFSMFLFLSLAFAKRYAEIALLKRDATRSGRGYIETDLDLIRSVGPSSGSLSVMVFCLYLSSPEVARYYPHPTRLCFLCPLLLYWILRIWFVTHREKLEEDPVLFALKDRISWAIAALSVLVIIAASRD
jgi:4-hydroxybenzoate polyprenyltransferase